MRQCHLVKQKLSKINLSAYCDSNAEHCIIEMWKPKTVAHNTSFTYREVKLHKNSELSAGTRRLTVPFSH